MHPVSFCAGMQVTTPDDMSVAERFLEEAAAAAAALPEDPLEAARLAFCEEEPSAKECKVFDE
jgi:hypothetical protein